MRPGILSHGGPLIRTKSAVLDAASVHRVPRIRGVQNGKPLLEDGRVLDVTTIIWYTGFHPGFSWIDLPVFGEHEPRHHRGIVRDMPGLFFLGLHFLYSMTSTMIHGVERDAKYVVDAIASRNGFTG
jgi:putative flavoprotein involved in K+ transport